MATAHVPYEMQAAPSDSDGLLESVGSGVWETLNAQLFQVGNHSVTAWSLFAAALLIAGGWLASQIVQRMVVAVFRRSRVTDEGVVGTVRRLIHYAIMVSAIFLALPLIGVDITGLFAAGALFAVAVGFALQQILQNFVSGVLLLSERSITPHDVLEVDGRMVQVVDMRIRSTIARTRDEEEIIIPNSTLVQSSVKNYTLRDSVLRLRTQVGVAYDSDVDRVFEVLHDAAMRVEERDASVDPAVLFLEFGDSALIFDVSVWVDDPWASRTTRSVLNRHIWRALKDEGIVVAFPQLDVHLNGVLSTRADPRGPQPTDG